MPRLRAVAWAAAAAFLCAALYAFLHRPEPLPYVENPGPAGPAGPMDGPALAEPAPPVNNEMIHDFLEKEKKKMGIVEIVPPDKDAAPAELGPMSEAEAKAHMKRMSRQLRRQQEQLAPESSSVPLGEGATPALIGKPEGRRGGGSPIDR